MIVVTGVLAGGGTMLRGTAGPAGAEHCAAEHAGTVAMFKAV